MLKKIKKACIQNNLYYIIFILLQISTIKSKECEREKPIRLLNGSCVMQYCSKSQYKSKECIIENKIIKTQFPNDIIFVGEKSFPYFNFLTFSNGDLLLQTTSYPKSNKRFYNAIKKDSSENYFKGKKNLKLIKN